MKKRREKKTISPERLTGILADIERYRRKTFSLEMIARLLDEVKHEGTPAQYDWVLKTTGIERWHAESLIARYKNRHSVNHQG